MSSLLGLLQKHEQAGLRRCYTCLHPVAKGLIPKLIKALKAEQTEGRMLVYSEKALLRVVIEHCREQGKPYQRKIQHFKSHLEKDTDWYEQTNAS